MTLVAKSPALTLYRRLALWAALCALASAIFFRDFWSNAGFILSPAYARTYGLLPWAVLGFCVLFLWAKKGTIAARARTAGTTPLYIAAGASVLAFAVAVPFPEDNIVLQLLLGFLGIFIMLFAQAALLPTLLVAVYAVAKMLPIVIEMIAGGQYSLATAVPATAVLKFFGLPVTNQGNVIHIPNSSGADTVALVNSACSGTESMGMFLALFGLMMMDVGLPRRTAALMLVFGLAGTYLQNLLRVEILLLSGYYSGQGAMLSAHEWLPYVIFPAWFALFAFVYFRVARKTL